MPEISACAMGCCTHDLSQCHGGYDISKELEAIRMETTDIVTMAREIADLDKALRAKKLKMATLLAKGAGLLPAEPTPVTPDKGHAPDAPGLTSQLREYFADNPGPQTTQGLAEWLQIPKSRRKYLSVTLANLVKRGELTRVNPGVFQATQHDDPVS